MGTRFHQSKRHSFPGILPAQPGLWIQDDGFHQTDFIHSFDSLRQTDSRASDRPLACFCFLLFFLTQAFHNYIKTLSSPHNLADKYHHPHSKEYHHSLLRCIRPALLSPLPSSPYLLLLLITALLLFIWYRLQPNLLKLLIAVLPSAILLWLTTSTRILGPFAGLIVVYFALRTKAGRQSLLLQSML